MQKREQIFHPFSFQPLLCCPDPMFWWHIHSLLLQKHIFMVLFRVHVCVNSLACHLCIMQPYTWIPVITKGNIASCPQQSTGLTHMLLVANLANTKWCWNLKKWLKPWQMGTHLRVLSKSYPMNTNMTGFRWFSKIFVSLCFGQK